MMKMINMRLKLLKRLSIPTCSDLEFPINISYQKISVCQFSLTSTININK